MNSRNYGHMACIGWMSICGFVFAAGSVLRGAQASASPTGGVVPQETQSTGGTLRQAQENNGTKRTLEVFYSRRAYPGAPPIIPHKLPEDRTLGGKICLACHAEGAWTALYRAYAPATPHPTWLNCRQCHVPQTDSPPFRGSTWQKIPGPALNRETPPKGPPPIPHDLQLRENCVACHGGPGAVVEIRSPHPQRPNCRRCHTARAGQP